MKNRPLRWLASLVVLALAAAQSAFAQITVQTSAGSGGANDLVLQQSPDATADWRVYESSGFIVGDRIEFRFASSLAFEQVSAPGGWDFLSSSDEDQAQNLVTYFYAGFNEAQGSEYFPLSDPAYFSFLLTSSDSELAGKTVAMELDLFARVAVPGFGLLPASYSESVFVTVAVPEMSSNLIVAAGLLAVMLARCSMSLSRCVRRRASPDSGPPSPSGRITQSLSQPCPCLAMTGAALSYRAPIGAEKWKSECSSWTIIRSRRKG